MTPRTLAMLVTVLMITFLASGCRPGNPQGRKAITGQVTVDGAPLESGTIDFQPVGGGVTSSGGMVTNGQYQINEEEGLPPGKYRVTITASPPQPTNLPAGYMPGDDLPAAPPAKQTIPQEWNDKGETIEVKPDGANQFDFSIDTKKK